MKRIAHFVLICTVICSCTEPVKQEFKTETMFQPFQPPITYNDAKEQALNILNQMTIDEKISLIGGHNVCFSQKGLRSLMCQPCISQMRPRE